MMLLNKCALSGFTLSSLNTLMLCQCISSAVGLKAAEAVAVGMWPVEKPRSDAVPVRSESSGHSME